MIAAIQIPSVRWQSYLTVLIDPAFIVLWFEWRDWHLVGVTFILHGIADWPARFDYVRSTRAIGDWRLANLPIPVSQVTSKM